MTRRMQGCCAATKSDSRRAPPYHCPFSSGKQFNDHCGIVNETVSRDCPFDLSTHTSPPSAHPCPPATRPSAQPSNSTPPPSLGRFYLCQKVAFSPLPSAKLMKRVDTVELDVITFTTTIPPRAWGTGEYTPPPTPPAKAVAMVFGVHGGHVATCQSGSRFVRRLSFYLLLLFEPPTWPTGSCRV
jgi:hypothetical protein